MGGLEEYCADPEARFAREKERERRGLIRYCDTEGCEAIENPRTLDEYRAAVEHWRDHEWSGGCSHGGV